MNPPYIPIRLLLILSSIVNAALGYLLLFSLETITAYMEVVQIDSLHVFLAMSAGALLLGLGLAAIIAFLDPYHYRSILLVLLLAYFSLFLVDIIVLARNQIRITILLPSVVYFLLLCTGFIRFFPKAPTVPQKKEKEQKKEDATPKSSDMIDVLDGIVPDEAIVVEEEK